MYLNLCFAYARLSVSVETMVRTSIPVHFRRTAACLLIAGVYQTPMAVWAQAPEEGYSAIQREREATRRQIEDVRADQAGVLDNASTLGRTLPLELLERQSQARTDAAAPNAPLLLDTGEAGVVDQWPILAAPTKQRLVKRPEPFSVADQTADGKPVYTPDFTRQRLTLAGLVNQAVIDLPNQEVAGVATDAPQVKPSLDGLTTFNLYDLVGVGLSYSPIMDQTLSQLERATSQAKQTRAGLLPNFSLRYATGKETSQTQGSAADSHTTKTLGARLTQPLVNIPVVRDWASDLSAQRAANWRLQATRESVSSAVTKAVAELATARVVLEFSDEQLRHFDDLLSYVLSRAQTGAASTADLERTRGRVLLARQIRVEQQAAYRNALLEVQRLTGQVPEALELPYLNQLPGLPATHAELRRLVWQSSYDLRALRADIRAQDHTVSSEYSKLLPKLDLSLEHDEATNVRAVNPKQTDNRLLAVLTWDMSLGGREIYAGKIAAAELNNRQAKLTEEGERLMLSVDADFALLQSATLRVNTGEAELRATAAVVASVLQQLKTGRIGSLIEALDAFERHFAARQRLAQTLSQQMQAQAQLLRRLGFLSQLNEKAGVQLEPASAIVPTALTGAAARDAAVAEPTAGATSPDNAVLAKSADTVNPQQGASTVQPDEQAVEQASAQVSAQVSPVPDIEQVTQQATDQAQQQQPAQLQAQ
jgi:outer membrane protein TolC